MPAPRRLLLSLLLAAACLAWATPQARASALDDLGASLAVDDIASGLAAHGRGDIRGAIKRYDQALDSNRLTPENRAVALNNRGNAYDDLGETDKALADYNQAVKLVPTFSEAYFNRSFVLYKMQRFDDCQADLDRVIRLSPDQASAYFNRSFVLIMKGLVAQAIADVEKAVQLEPDNAKYRQQLEELQAAAAQLPPAAKDGKAASGPGRLPTTTSLPGGQPPAQATPASPAKNGASQR